MTQADSVHSTPPINTPIDTTRRRFLSQAAAVAAGGAALGVALPLPVSAGAPERVPDPILAAIDAHKAARVVVYSAVDAVIVREKQLADEGKRNRRACEGDTQLEECEAALHRAFDAETEAACVLVSNCPTTMAGVMALLQYAHTADIDGEGWPSDLQSDDGKKTRSWHYFLIEMLADALPGMGPTS